MKVSRPLEELKITGDGMFEIELSDSEMHEAYEKQRRLFMIDDISMEVEGRIYECNEEDHYSKDWPYRFGQALAGTVLHAIEGDSIIQEQYSVAVVTHVERKLKELGIDPDTMKRKKAQNSEA